MRVAVLASLVLLALTPAAIAGVQGCYAIPPGSLAGHGSCSVSFYANPGIIQATIEVFAGSVGEVVIIGNGPNDADLYASCTLAYSSGVCSPVFGIFGPTAGPWTWTARADNVNVFADASVWFSVSYP